ncbi:TraR/DksA family transcriptional regulator [Streptomyces chattanoogensis]|uniref:DNA-binding protein n=1 Tax=Streptomyces chattanoogensis TaxID=66876 RepID=A0A0N0XWK9_9ACTN|nr:TraR/DksA C4-type zinc finger protein [Streptomyces chattanoogensis]KPC61707.1 DNA-binding protein [Streptomyces chattanoogensis]
MVAKKTAAQRSSTPADEADEAAAKQPAPAKTAPGTKTARTKTAHPHTARKTTAPQKAAPKATAPKKAAAKKADPKTAQKAEAKAPAGKAAAKTSGTKTSGTKTAGTRTAVTKTASKTAARKTAARNAAVPAKKTGAHTVVAKKTAAAEAHAMDGTVDSAVPPARVAAAAPGELAVRPGEDPWTPQEVDEARSGLLGEAGRLRAEIVASEDAIAGLMRDSGDGAGDDEADTGSKNITREHELALASNAREMLQQTERALGRLDAGTYGLCENCGNPIGKARMQAFPRATLCVECKQRQERRV